MNKFTLGIATGVSSLALAIPILAQIAGAQSSSSASAITSNRPIPSQECVQAMAALEEAHLSSFDTMMALQKKSLQTRINALEAAGQISDDTARQEALQTMHEQLRSMHDATKDDIPETVTTAMDAVRTACGDLPGHRDKHGMMMGMVDSFPDWHMHGEPHMDREDDDGDEPTDQ